jgi:serine/threonine protein kinase
MKQKGGRYLDSGAFGCLFAPPLTCEEHQDSRTKLRSLYKGTVGKVFQNEFFFYNELDNIDKLKQNRIDPNHRFTVKIPKSCYATSPGKRDLRNIPDCCSLTEQPSPQIIMENGGKNLADWAHEHVQNANAFIAMFVKLQPLLQGLKRINAKGLVHCDIKPNNILYNGKKLFLIDFGLITKSTKLYHRRNDFMLSYDYPYYPIEFKLYVAYVLKHAKSMHPFQLRKMMDMNFKGSLHAWLDKFQDLGIHVHESFRNVIGRIESQTTSKRSDVFESFANRVDVYGMGITLLQIYEIMEINTIYGKCPVQVQMTLELVRRFIQRLIDPDPNIRYTIQDTIKHYRRIIQIIQ